MSRRGRVYLKALAVRQVVVAAPEAQPTERARFVGRLPDCVLGTGPGRRLANSPPSP
jgi:hypothetical protein